MMDREKQLLRLAEMAVTALQAVHVGPPLPANTLAAAEQVIRGALDALEGEGYIAFVDREPPVTAPLRVMR